MACPTSTCRHLHGTCLLHRYLEIRLAVLRAMRMHTNYEALPCAICLSQDGGDNFFEVEVIDPTADWIALIRRAFDLPAIRRLLAREVCSAEHTNTPTQYAVSHAIEPRHHRT